MKKIFIAILAAASMQIVTSCDHLDLDLAPEDYFSSGSFWKNESQVNGAMLGIHNLVRGQQQTFWGLGEAKRRYTAHRYKLHRNSIAELTFRNITRYSRECSGI